MDIEKIEETLAREEIELAPLWKRLVAFIIDDLLISMVLIGIASSKIHTIKKRFWALFLALGLPCISSKLYINGYLCVFMERLLVKLL